MVDSKVDGAADRPELPDLPPFPGKALTVTAVQGAVPAGVQVTPSADKSTLPVSSCWIVGLDTKAVVHSSLCRSLLRWFSQ